MNKTVAYSLLSLSLVIVMGRTYAQEVPLSSFPTQMRQPVPDRAVHRIFLNHVAAFETQARSLEAQGKSGQAFRNHLMRKFGLSSTEQTTIAEFALSFQTQLAPLKAKQKAALPAFIAQQKAARHAGAASPTMPPDLALLKGSVNNLILGGRDQIRAALGNNRFAQLDGAIKQKFQHDFNSPTGRTGAQPGGDQ